MSINFDKMASLQMFTEKVATNVVKNFQDGKDIQPLYQIKNKAINEIDDNLDEVDMEIYKGEVEQFVQRKMNLRRNLEKSYGLIWRQCSADL